jgi:hypothetical protein
MERGETTLLDTFDTRALLDEAMDAALGEGSGAFAKLTDGVGFRERAHGAVEAIRLAGLGSKELDRAKLQDRAKQTFLSRMVRKYEQLLVARRRMDTADVLRLAIAAMEEVGSSLPPALHADVVVLVPGLGMRGLAGRLTAGLVARGAKLLESEPALGLETPSKLLWKGAKDPAPGSFLHAPADAPAEGGLDADFFRGASVHDELREVLRRAVERGLPWDRVEIVTPDPETYGSALHALATRLGRVSRLIRFAVCWKRAISVPIARAVITARRLWRGGSGRCASGGGAHATESRSARLSRAWSGSTPAGTRATRVCAGAVPGLGPSSRRSGPSSFPRCARRRRCPTA